MNDQHETEDDETQEMLERMAEEAGAGISTCRYQSTFNQFGELRQRARQEGQAQYYVHATFFQMDQAQYLLDYVTMRERAIELISLLSDYEQLLKIQPDISSDYFDYAVYTMRPCGYENLAEATGAMEGYNSEGLHECISDGIQVCRSVGKLGCINCFREYACDVYLAADDFELAQHQCLSVVGHEGEWQARGNRRWLAQNRLAWICALHGDLEDAKKGYEKALYFTDEPDVSIPLESRFKVLVELDAVRIALGEDQLLPDDKIAAELPPEKECLLFDVKRAWNKALEASMANDHDSADKILEEWDGMLRERNATHLWFENRLRQISSKRLGGHTKTAENLAETVEERAKEANDWLTIRRLNEVIGDSDDPSPLGVKARPSGSARAKDLPTDPESNDSAATPSTDSSAQREFPEITPEVQDHLENLSARLQSSLESENSEQAAAGISSVIEDMLSVPREQCKNWTDHVGYLNLMLSLTQIYVGDNGSAIWKWTNGIASAHQKDGYVISLLATVGHHVRRASEDPENCHITEDRLRQLFKRSLQLMTDGPGTYYRAGDFFESVGDYGEAERCFARSFKLSRADGDIAVRLAAIYDTTERPRDALHVLDLCLREGTESPAVAYHAAQTAMELEQYESMLTYVDRLLTFENVNEESPIPYYRALGHLKLGNASAALQYIEQESALAEGQFHCHAIRCCASAETGNRETALHEMKLVLDTELKTLSYLPPRDVVLLSQMIYDSIDRIDPPVEQISTLEDRLLLLGRMPDGFFDAKREQNEVAENLNFFIVLISQSLGEHWCESKNCLPGFEEWDHYIAEWGVLAETEDQASELVLAIQARCGGDETRVLEVREEAGPFNDSPGVTFQGQRRFVPFETLLGGDENEPDN